MVDLTPEVKAQLEEQKKNCPFCKIIAGDITSKKVYEDSKINCILDINPWSKGHTLIVPKEHYPILPFIDPETFEHIFGMMPKFVNAIKSGVICTSVNVIIANGGVAGQQSPHFLIHLYPRDDNDGIFLYLFENEKNSEKADIKERLNQHFQKSFGQETKIRADFLNNVKDIIYENSDFICYFPDKSQAKGHVVFRPKREEKFFENLTSEESKNIFYGASLASSIVFESLGAHGTNIILKTGHASDNPSGEISLHVLPRYSEDGLDLIPKPMEEKPDLDDVAVKIKDSMFMIEYEQKSPKKVAEVERFTEKINREVEHNEVWDAIDKIINE